MYATVLLGNGESLLLQRQEAAVENKDSCEESLTDLRKHAFTLRLGFRFRALG